MQRCQDPKCGKTVFYPRVCCPHCQGAALAWVLFNGHSVSTLGGAFAQVVFKLTVTRTLIVTGILWACIIGVVGGLFPALRAARLSVAEALRAA